MNAKVKTLFDVLKRHGVSTPQEPVKRPKRYVDPLEEEGYEFLDNSEIPLKYRKQFRRKTRR